MKRKTPYQPTAGQPIEVAKALATWPIVAITRYGYWLAPTVQSKGSIYCPTKDLQRVADDLLGQGRR